MPNSDDKKFEPQICIIGSKGSGKTVLLTMLAHMYGKALKRPFLTHDNEATIDFEENVRTLVQEKEWPRPTEPPKQNGINVLQWKLRIDDDEDTTCILRSLDCSGQHIFDIYSSNFDSDKVRNEHLVALKKYIDESNIIIFLHNLWEIYDAEIKTTSGAQDEKAREDASKKAEKVNESRKLFMNFFKNKIENDAHKERIAIVIPQIDRLKDFVGNEKNLSLDDGLGLIGKIDSQAYQMLERFKNEIKIIPVSAVGERPRECKKDEDESPKSATVPQIDVGSLALPSIMSWICNIVLTEKNNEKVKKLNEENAKEKSARAEAEAKNKELEEKQEKSERRKAFIWIGCMAGICAFAGSVIAFLIWRLLSEATTKDASLFLLGCFPYLAQYLAIIVAVVKKWNFFVKRILPEEKKNSD